MLVGPLLEERYGSIDLIIMMVITTIIAGIAFLILNPAVDGVLPNGLGASGIVFMLILLSSVTNAEKGRLPLTLIFASIFYIGTELFANYKVSDGDEATNISHVSHIIGGICGAVFGVYLGKIKAGEKEKK
jgi:membrane associated rhomboid family serine protease